MKSRKLKIAIWTIVMVGILGTAIMLLWNWLIPSLLGLPTISFLQSLGLFVLSRILFGGFGHFGRGFGHRENSFRKKWEQMSPEKRQEFLDRRARFGFGHHRNKEQYDEESRTEE